MKIAIKAIVLTIWFITTLPFLCTDISGWHAALAISHPFNVTLCFWHFCYTVEVVEQTVEVPVISDVKPCWWCDVIVVPQRKIERLQLCPKNRNKRKLNGGHFPIIWSISAPMSFWQFSVQSMMYRSSNCRHFRLNDIELTFLKDTLGFNYWCLPLIPASGATTCRLCQLATYPEQCLSVKRSSGTWWLESHRLY